MYKLVQSMHSACIIYNFFHTYSPSASGSPLLSAFESTGYSHSYEDNHNWMSGYPPISPNYTEVILPEYGRPTSTEQNCTKVKLSVYPT